MSIAYTQWHHNNNYIVWGWCILNLGIMANFFNSIYTHNFVKYQRSWQYFNIYIIRHLCETIFLKKN